MRWKPSASKKREQAVADGLRRASKFYVFLWSIREELFEDAFEDELIAAYAPRGQEPCPPAMLAMVMLLQRYEGLSDAGLDPGRLEYRERTVVEHRLARIDALQGPKARYNGVRKNELDVRRAAAVANLQEVSRLRLAA